MSYSRGILIAGATLLASSLAAQAADLYGGRGSIKDDYVEAPVRSGCPSWYARIDGSYSTYDRPSMNQAGVDELIGVRIKDGGNFGGGLGHYFTCNIRGDITVDHRYNSDVHGFNPNPFAPNFGQMKWGYESTAVLANMYYDFNPGARITPYIGFGLGAVHNEFSKGRGVVAAGAFNPLDVGSATYVNSSSTWQAAGAAMTGFVFNIHDRLKLDTGYRFLYLGAGKTGQTGNAFGGTGGFIHADSMHVHEFRVGLRYDIR